MIELTPLGYYLTEGLRPVLDQLEEFDEGGLQLLWWGFCNLKLISRIDGRKVAGSDALSNAKGITEALEELGLGEWGSWKEDIYYIIIAGMEDNSPKSINIRRDLLMVLERNLFIEILPETGFDFNYLEESFIGTELV
ncbi:hypothetical protein OAI95_00900 [Candidatus Poseidoniales archaeon]|nr:hypothetical protein [Candidatus Poseidoniales archaeon]